MASTEESTSQMENDEEKVMKGKEAATGGDDLLAGGDDTDADADDAGLIIREALADAFRSKSSNNNNSGGGGSSSGTAAGSSGIGIAKQQHDDLRIKLEYMGEKRSVLMTRPVSFLSLTAKIESMYGRPLIVYYTVPNSEIIVPIRSQSELEKAVELVGKSSHMRSLRLLLSKHSDAAVSLQNSTAGQYSSKITSSQHEPSPSTNHNNNNHGDNLLFEPSSGNSLLTGETTNRQNNNNNNNNHQLNHQRQQRQEPPRQYPPAPGNSRKHSDSPLPSSPPPKIQASRSHDPSTSTSTTTSTSANLPSPSLSTQLSSHQPSSSSTNSTPTHDSMLGPPSTSSSNQQQELLKRSLQQQLHSKTGRFSPPPGTVSSSKPARRKFSSRTSSRRSEGEFIPELSSNSSNLVVTPPIIGGVGGPAGSGGDVKEVPYFPFSSASSRASSRLSQDGCSQCSGPSSGNGLFLRPYGHHHIYDDLAGNSRSSHHHQHHHRRGYHHPPPPPTSSKGTLTSAGTNKRSPLYGGGGGGGGGGEQYRLFQQQMVASRASSSSSSGLVPDIVGGDVSGIGRRSGADAGGRGPNSATSPRAPTNWRQGRCLGSGAFGSVYLCYDADTSRELAVKRVLMRANLHNEKNLRKEVASLENEITLLKNLQHDRVVQYLGFTRDEESVCIFMEYMPGGSVKDEIRSYGPLNERVVVKYTRQILEGLCYLHHYEIVHRDIKCANILRDGAGNVKIGDFGSGKRLQTICSQSAAITFIGTPYFMAPEVINGKRYGRKADIWSLGCSLIEMLTGSPPWKELEPMAAIFRIASEKTPPEIRLPPKTNPDVHNFLRSLFKRNPEDRPHAAQAINHNLLSL